MKTTKRPPGSPIGRQRYQEYLNADSGETFKEWLKRRQSTPKDIYGRPVVETPIAQINDLPC